MPRGNLATSQQIEEKIKEILSNEWGKDQEDNVKLLYKLWGLKLRRKRIKLNLSLAQVGKMWKVSPQQVEKYENMGKGHNKLSFDKIIIFCEKTGTGYNYFLDILNGITLTNGGING